MAGGDDPDRVFDDHGDAKVFGEVIERAQGEDAQGDAGMREHAGDAADGAVAAAGDDGLR